MTLENKIIEINKIEDLGLSIFEFDNVNWWPLIRIYLFQVQKNNDAKDIKNNLPWYKRVIWEIKVWRNQNIQLKSLKKNTLLKSKNSNTLFLTAEKNYKINSQNVFINRYLDPLYLKCKEGKVNFVYSQKKKDKYLIDELVSTEYFELKIKQKKQFKSILNALFLKTSYRNYSNQHHKKINDIINYLKTFSLCKDYNFSNLYNWFNQVDESKQIALSIFNVVKPKIFVQYCYYSSIKFGYFLAANSLNITTVDYQHGIQNKYHFAYGSFSNVPKSGYQLLPKEFWVYSKNEELNLLNSFSETTHKIKVIGNAWIDFWKQNKTDSVHLNWITDIKNNKKTIILFTISSYLLDSNHFFWSFLKQCPSHLFFLFRLHPGHLYLKEKLENNLKQINFFNYNISEATSTELYDILENTNIHITQNSTVAEEALMFNIKTILIDKNCECYFENYISQNEMYLAHNEHELSDMIATNLKTNPIAC